MRASAAKPIIILAVGIIAIHASGHVADASYSHRRGANGDKDDERCRTAGNSVDFVDR